LRNAVQEAAQAGQGAGAVAYFILDFFTQFRERLGETFRDKERVVAKSARPAGAGGDAAFANAFKQERALVPVRQRQDTPEPRRAPRGRDAFEQPEEFGVVGRIGGIGCFRRAAAGEPRRVNAGGASEGIHFQTGIVGQDKKRAVPPARLPLGRQPGSESPGFFGGVAGERGGIFDHGRRARKIVLRKDVNIPGHNPADFRNLAGVARG